MSLPNSQLEKSITHTDTNRSRGRHPNRQHRDQQLHRRQLPSAVDERDHLLRRLPQPERLHQPGKSSSRLNHNHAWLGNRLQRDRQPVLHRPLASLQRVDVDLRRAGHHRLRRDPGVRAAAAVRRGAAREVTAAVVGESGV